MTKISNPEEYRESEAAKGGLKYNERSRILLFGLPWTFTRYEIRENTLTIIKGFFNVSENDCYMYRISDVMISTTLFQRMAGLSTITCYTSDVTDKTIIMKNIRHGHEIKDYLLSASENARIRRRTVNMQDIGYNNDELDVDGDMS